MASVFKRKYNRIVSGKKVKKQSKCWYVKYRDADGIERRVKELECQMPAAGIQHIAGPGCNNSKSGQPPAHRAEVSLEQIGFPEVHHYENERDVDDALDREVSIQFHLFALGHPQIVRRFPASCGCSWH